MIYHALLEAKRSGIEELIVAVNRKKETLYRYLEEEDLSNNSHITLIEQPSPLGSGEAVYRAKDMIGEQPFALMMPDFVHFGPHPALSQMIPLYEQFGHDTVGIVELDAEFAKGFGNVGVAQVKEMEPRVVEVVSFSKKLKDPLVIEEGRVIQKLVGRWILGPHFFSYLERVREDKDWDDASALQALSREKRIIGKILEGTGFDVGNPFGFQRAVDFFKGPAALTLKRTALEGR